MRKRDIWCLHAPFKAVGFLAHNTPQEAFHARLAEKAEEEGGGEHQTYLRTGDLGFLYKGVRTYCFPIDCGAHRLPQT
jgi:hypothetical protein